VLREIDFLLKNFADRTGKQICASLSHRKVMKKGHSWLIPRKLAVNPELSIVVLKIIILFFQVIIKFEEVMRSVLPSKSCVAFLTSFFNLSLWQFLLHL